jgi:putative flavoprotein involved in K+ transport
MEKIETVIVGGGQAGLSTSYYLNYLGREHVVLEQAHQAGHTWRTDRWDSFTLLTPNWSIKLPGASYRGDNPVALCRAQSLFPILKNILKTLICLFNMIPA